VRGENRERGSQLETADRSWFEPLARTFERPAYHFAAMLTRDRGVAEELVQEAFARVWASPRLGKNLANFQLNCGSVGWLAPNQSVTFAMVLDMPANPPPVPVGLRWTLHSAYGNGTGAAGVSTANNSGGGKPYPFYCSARSPGATGWCHCA